MLHKILAGYAKTLADVGRVLLLFLACVVVALAVIYPLWAFALASPRAYTIVVLSIALALIVVAIVLRMRSYLRASGEDAEEKARRARSCVCTVLKVLIVLAALSLFVVAVLAHKRWVGIAILVVAFVLYGIVAFGTEKRSP